MENLTDKERDEKYNENYEVKLKSEFFKLVEKYFIKKLQRCKFQNGNK